MGCDIHVHVEMRIHDHWYHYSAPYVDRDYKLFGFMVGVRSDEVDPIVAPRGLPDDMSFLTAHDAQLWRRNMHHPSWLTWQEVAEVVKFAEEKLGWKQHPPLFGYVFGNSIAPNAAKGIEDARIIFWFDN